MSLFAYTDYKIWFNTLVKSMPKGGRGQLSQLARFLNTSPVIITQVFKGDRDITPEHAVLLAEYLGLTKTERSYLILLVNHSRAGSYHYKKILSEEIEEQRKKGLEVKSHVHQEKDLTEKAKSILYANWYYLAIWSLVAIPKFNNVQAISEKLDLPRKKIQEAVNFLIDYQLIAEQKNKLVIGTRLLHLESESIHIPRHHQNWRLRAFRNYDKMTSQDLSYTAPMTLSKSDAVKVREKLMRLISETVTVVKDSPSEESFCLCLDWFEF